LHDSLIGPLIQSFQREAVAFRSASDSFGKQSVTIFPRHSHAAASPQLKHMPRSMLCPFLPFCGVMPSAQNDKSFDVHCLADFQIRDEEHYVQKVPSS
jgi:hypothetical protein